jgi:hypothetical protein
MGWRPIGAPVLVVVASRDDHAARTLVERWQQHGACLLTCADLSMSGWRYRLDTSGARPSTAVVNGRVLETGQIRGVLSLLPCVFPHELLQIVPGDRDYVAQEMTAFLLAWLAGLDCPVLNRPNAISLMGPSWPPERWRHLAVRVGLRAAPLRRQTLGAPASSILPLPPTAASVTVVGDCWVGDVPAELAAQGRRLADAAGVELLTVVFDRADPEASFLVADPYPAISDQRVADALLGFLHPAADSRAPVGAHR